MDNLCYLFAFISEQFISYIYCEKKLQKCRKSAIIFLCYTASFAVQYLINFLNSPIMNSVAFFICNFIILLFCFETKLKDAVFNAVILLSLMLTTEMLLMLLVSIWSDTNLGSYEDNASILMLHILASKSFYFFLVNIFAKLNVKSKFIGGTQDFLLLFLNLISGSVSIVFSYVFTQFNFADEIQLPFVIISLIMFISNTFAFFIHDKIVKALIENAEYALELQKIEIDNKYYSEIERQYEERSMLIHDIKKHMDIVSSLADDKDFAGIKKYIATVYDSNDVSSFKVFSRNRIVNVIVNRYNSLCKENGTEFNGDIRNVDFDFMAQSDITSLLTNLLENACESAKKSTQKKVDFLVENKHPFVTITLINSCDTKPTRKDDVYVTEKEDKFNHGYGTKIIRKISRRYHGKTTYEFDAENKKFTTTVVLRTDGKR